MLHADASHSGRTIKLNIGEALQLTLAENPTTGYRWVMRPAAEVAPASQVPAEAPIEPSNLRSVVVCQLVNDDYEAGTGAIAGHGGIHHWRFQAVGPGLCSIELEYRRAWETGKPPERTFRIKLKVRKGARDKTPTKPSE